MAVVAEDVLVRDAKDADPQAPVLRFNAQEWDAFLAGVVDGQFSRTVLKDD